ncbi:hypothetical protein BH24GEM1_BH24GEM1_18440 [soil metagenome]
MLTGVPRALLLLLAGVSTPLGAQDYSGRWEAASDDGTEQHVAQLGESAGRVDGTVTALEVGYFSGNVSVREQLELIGTVRGGTLEFTGTLISAGEEAGQSVSGSAVRRGEYLVIRVGTYQLELARPGTPLVRSAEGSTEAFMLARAISGREYSTRSEARGGGAYVGSRVHLALCAGGRIEYSRSDLATTPGSFPDARVDMGSSYSRRGTWTVVLYAGVPVVRAEWEGSGTSYSLVAYLRVEPSADGSTAIVDGMELPSMGRC